MITAKHIPWEPIANLPENRKDGRRMLLWEGDVPVIGRWDCERECWEDPESMHLIEDVTHWADITPPQSPLMSALGTRLWLPGRRFIPVRMTHRRIGR